MKYKTPTVCAAFAAALFMFDVIFEYDTTKLGGWEEITLGVSEAGVDTSDEWELAMLGEQLYIVRAVPEPATIAAIMGALALGLAFRNRRR